MDIKLVDERLGKLAYAQVADHLRSASDGDLLLLLDAKSVRVADTAADLLSSRNKEEAVIDAVLGGQIKTARGRVRATNILTCVGKAVPRAEQMYLSLLGDRSVNVVSNALFGLVFWQNKENIPKIEQARARRPDGSNMTQYYDSAINALLKNDPRLFSPYFCDEDNVWQLNE